MSLRICTSLARNKLTVLEIFLKPRAGALPTHSPGNHGTAEKVSACRPTSVASMHWSICKGTLIVATMLSHLQVLLGSQIGNGLLDPEGR